MWGLFSNIEQLVMCLRWVDDNLEIHEDFIGLFPLDIENSETMLSVIKDAILRMNLKLSDARDQCYDGAELCQAISLELQNAFVMKTTRVYTFTAMFILLTSE